MIVCRSFSHLYCLSLSLYSLFGCYCIFLILLFFLEYYTKSKKNKGKYKLKLEQRLYFASSEANSYHEANPSSSLYLLGDLFFWNGDKNFFINKNSKYKRVIQREPKRSSNQRRRRGIRRCTRTSQLGLTPP